MLPDGARFREIYDSFWLAADIYQIYTKILLVLFYF